MLMVCEALIQPAVCRGLDLFEVNFTQAVQLTMFYVN